ncbi:MAG: hypothetical protein ACKERG_00625 [Candidatus Hodgkinia cicadicola]
MGGVCACMIGICGRWGWTLEASALECEDGGVVHNDRTEASWRSSRELTRKGEERWAAREVCGVKVKWKSKLLALNCSKRVRVS